MAVILADREVMDDAQSQDDQIDNNPIWVLHLTHTARVEGYVIRVCHPTARLDQLNPGDGVFLTLFGSVKSIGRVYRVRQEHNQTIIYLSAHRPLSTDHKFPVPDALADKNAVVEDCDHAIARALIEAAGIGSYASLSTVNKGNKHDVAYVRSLLTLAIKDDLLGPANGPTELVQGVNVRDRYLIGKLAPSNTKAQIGLVPVALETANPDKNDPIGNEETTTSFSLEPSSMGFTCCVSKDTQELQIEATWGHYTRVEVEGDEAANGTAMVWRREPAGGAVTINLQQEPTTQAIPDAQHPDVHIECSTSEARSHNGMMVSIFLVNKQTKPSKLADTAWLFQPSLSVHTPANEPVFIHQPAPKGIGFDVEEDNLNMLYRNYLEFAKGHGVSVHATVDPANPETATCIETNFLPAHEVNITETPGEVAGDRTALKGLLDQGLFDMAALAKYATPEHVNTLVAGLSYFVDDYERWINELSECIGTRVKRFDLSACEARTRCLEVKDRLRAGVETLRENPKALMAFQFTNAAMANQRIQAKLAQAHRRGDRPSKQDVDVSKNRSWRPFQLAFLLLSIPELADPTHTTRSSETQAIADLLWFPTGGGKTEAYLGVAAFTMAIRRLQGDLGGLDASQGLAVIMRYTLRLLTLQQFQRAAGLICAMEIMRQATPDTWGPTPFSIGLWVGGSTTPNSFKSSHQYIAAIKAGRKPSGASPVQITGCPWCGSPIEPKQDIVTDDVVKRTYFFCSEAFGPCHFGRDTKAQTPTMRGIPVLVVDEEMYRNPPSILIGTVDKFAQMAWQSEVSTLFGQVQRCCPRHGLAWPGSGCDKPHQAILDYPESNTKPINRLRPPDLIIQDEFHLISGPLGTLVGLYEGAVDHLCSWECDGQPVLPKVVASTATVRKAKEQVEGVFARQLSIFPPNGVDVEDNFFSVQRPIATHPGRLYLGICPMGMNKAAIQTRVYTTLLSAGQDLFSHFGEIADPYMTVVGYFNALRDLGGMRRLCDDEVRTRTRRITHDGTSRPGLAKRYVNVVRELTSRISNKEIPAHLDHLEQSFIRDLNPKQQRPIDVVLATNMLSVGVDVNRIGLMVVASQPKTAAEYIQATSRVGRAYPGLVITMLNWNRPRDLSHFESFEYFHQTFYKHVEAQSVTPYSARALDRGLTGVLVSMARNGEPTLNPNSGAKHLTQNNRDLVEPFASTIQKRATRVKGKRIGAHVAEMLDDRIDAWIQSNVVSKELTYRGDKKTPLNPGLIHVPGEEPWSTFTVPNSMREVETPVRLIMNEFAKSFSERPWKSKEIQEEVEGDSNGA